MLAKKLLLINDDLELTPLLREYLTPQDYQLDVTHRVVCSRLNLSGRFFSFYCITLEVTVKSISMGFKIGIGIYVS